MLTMYDALSNICIPGLALPLVFLAKCYIEASVAKLATIFLFKLLIEMPVFQIFWSETINFAKMFQNTGQNLKSILNLRIVWL
jgi:hypothetical protein